MPQNQLNQPKFSNFAHYFICGGILLALIFWCCTAPALSTATDVYTPSTFHTEWSQQIGDEVIPLDSLQDYIPVDMGDSLVFTCTLPELKDDFVLLCYSDNDEVLFYIEDDLVHSFVMQEGFALLDTPGSAWVQMDLDADMSGKTCTLVIHSPLGEYDYLCNLYCVQAQYVDNVRFGYLWYGALSAVAIGFIMFVILLTSLAAEERHRKQYLWSIAQYFLIVLLWLLAELNVYDLFFARPVLSYLLGEVLKRILPLVLLRLARNSTNQYWHPKLFRTIEILAWVNLIVPLILQFTLEISLLHLRSISCITAALVNLSLLYIVMEKLFYLKKLNYEEYPCLAIPILVIGVGTDNALLYFNEAYHPFLGVWSALSCIIFSFVALMVLTHINACIAREKQSLSQACSALENANLVKQLEAHFIFNVLNSISAYCKTNPAMADKSIISFSSYLRAYLHLINQRENIPFQAELDLVEDYLTIQQLRFGQKLHFCFDTGYLDFKVPPFSVHTMVENAVIHGIKNSPHGGTVTISTRRTGDVVALTIEDTGAGFDTNATINETSVGLRNTKRRLELMSQGTIAIDSRIGAGTRVVMTIPIQSTDK